MNCSVSRNNHSLRILAIALVLMMLVSVLPISCALGESDEPDEVFTMDDILIYLDGDDGVKSKNKLKEYTIPDELLMADSNFAALMMEADKYIGYPYVYGASNPREGFDCSGFVCWVFIHSGVYNTGRRGATGLHTMCEEVDP